VMAIAAGRHYMDPVLIDVVMQRKKSESLASTASLTPREKEDLSLMREGKANKEIARGIHVSERTVKFHVSNILRRLDARNRLHAVHLSADRAGDLVSRIADVTFQSTRKEDGRVVEPG
jgi:DNA-binding NarL/FixJ family response regulator